MKTQFRMIASGTAEADLSMDINVPESTIQPAYLIVNRADAANWAVNTVLGTAFCPVTEPPDRGMMQPYVLEDIFNPGMPMERQVVLIAQRTTPVAGMDGDSERSFLWQYASAPIMRFTFSADVEGAYYELWNFETLEQMIVRLFGPEFIGHAQTYMDLVTRPYRIQQ